MSKIYRYIWISGGQWGPTWSTVHFLFIIQKNGTSTRAWPILKSNSTSFWFFFPRMNDKKIRKRVPQKFKKRWGGRRIYNLATMSRVASCDTPTLCGQSLCLWGRRRLCARIIMIFFLYMSFPNIDFFIVQMSTPPRVFIIERWNKLHYVQE